MWGAGLGFIGGVVAWSFAEYALHNWCGHLARGKNHFSREHLAHHGDTHYFTPTPQKILTALVAGVILGPLLFLALEWAGLAALVGFLGMYGVYEMVHRRIHTHPPTGFYSRWARRHHYYHHFVGPKYNHGVTSPVWDIVFRTYRAPGVIRVPEKQAMSWLLDPESGLVWGYLTNDYVLARRGDKKLSPEKRALMAAISQQKVAQMRG